MFFTQPAIRRRFTGGQRTRGRATAPSFTDEEIQTTVNPIPGEELQVLPEGERTGEQIRLLTTADLRSSDETAGLLADHVIWQGKTYEVRTVQEYRRVIPHIEVRARRVQGG